MLSDKILKEIEQGVITSRRKLYKKVGRSGELLQWLNDNKILIPAKWNAGRVKATLLNLRKQLRRLPKASDDEALTARAQKYYGTWNNAMREVFGITNKRFHNHLSNDELIKLVEKHVRIYQVLPLREEFDGKSPDYPHWEVYTHRFNISRWSQIYKYVNLKGIKYFHHTKHGYGRVYVHDGITYLSRQEYLIGRYLRERNILFEKEVPYGNSDYTFDFYLPEKNLYIEYFGINTAEYKNRIEKKRQCYANRVVLEIFKHDNTIAKLDSKVQRL